MRCVAGHNLIIFSTFMSHRAQFLRSQFWRAKSGQSLVLTVQLITRENRKPASDWDKSFLMRPLEVKTGIAVCVSSGSDESTRMLQCNTLSIK